MDGEFAFNAESRDQLEFEDPNASTINMGNKAIILVSTNECSLQFGRLRAFGE